MEIENVTNETLLSEIARRMVEPTQKTKQETLVKTPQQEERKMFPAICGICGSPTEVPFVPNGKGLIRCKKCYMEDRK